MHNINAMSGKSGIGGLTYRVEDEHLTQEMDNFMITVTREAVQYCRVGLVRCTAQNV